MKLNKIDEKFPLQVFEQNTQSISRKWQIVKNLLVNLSWKVYTFIPILHKMFLPSYLIVWSLQIKVWLPANV